MKFGFYGHKLSAKRKRIVKVGRRSDVLSWSITLLRSSRCDRWLHHSWQIHDKFVEEQQQSKRRPGWPREDCISCRAELKETHCDRLFAVYALTCTICSKEYISETQRPIRARVQEHFADTQNRKKDTPWGGGERVLSFHKDIHFAKEKTPIFTARILAFEEKFEGKRGKQSKLGTAGQKSIATVAGS